ncbi:uncharacterized protein LOC130826660 [Amaranthus tricolor]|uniref:uncharacterized protein LOC130826660 n=1 Tax=Amaranthus tricolor TaxID=29722 RepID=UPI00258EC320|nr:uncharacterized protein LOC130826660 [Amaranthus tricolor]
MNENGDFRSGQDFSSLDHLKKNVKAWVVSNNRNIRVIESESSKYVIQCTNGVERGCEWRMRAIMTATGSFMIVQYKGHNQDCSAHYSDDHPVLTSDFVVDLIVDMIRVDPAFKVKNSGAMGSPIDPTRVMFQRIFRAFGPSIKGFPHYRPLICIDGTHLYGKYKGTLMIAVAIDVNSQLFPLAFAVVEGESNDTWRWFLECIRHYVTKRDGLCVKSDRHKGILHAMNRVEKGWEESYAFYRFCKRHLALNVHKKFKNIATLIHDGGHRYGVKTTNMSEAFNGVMKGAGVSQSLHWLG